MRERRKKNTPQRIFHSAVLISKKNTPQRLRNGKYKMESEQTKSFWLTSDTCTAAHLGVTRACLHNIASTAVISDDAVVADSSSVVAAIAAGGAAG